MEFNKFMLPREKLISETEDRLKILLTVSIFFPVLLAASGFVAHEARDEKDSALFFGFVGLYLFGYLFFELVKNSFPLWGLKTLSRILFSAIGFFVVLILYLGGKIYQHPTSLIVLFDTLSFVVALWGMVITALVTAAFIPIASIVDEIQKWRRSRK